ncbi:MAG: hypothetical protein R2747_18480 [Pyrinomonadaceae bacterium]
MTKMLKSEAVSVAVITILVIGFILLWKRSENTDGQRIVITVDSDLHDKSGGNTPVLLSTAQTSDDAPELERIKDDLLKARMFLQQGEEESSFSSFDEAVRWTSEEAFKKKGFERVAYQNLSADIESIERDAKNGKRENINARVDGLIERFDAKRRKK